MTHKDKKALDALYSDIGTEFEEYDPLRITIHLKQQMEERGLTQTQLSELAGVRQATISQLCRGFVERLHIPTIEKIAHALNITDITKLLTFERESELWNMSTREQQKEYLKEKNNKTSAE